MSNKITYGLSNVHVWPITATSSAGVPTYGSIIEVPGAVEISLDAEGSSDPFYADDQVYYQGTANNGYFGSLTLADIPADMLTNVFAETVDSNGAYIENADSEPYEFAMAFEFKGDAKKRRHLFYRCKATRPSVASSTKEDSVSPNTPELDITVMPRLDTQDVKARCEYGDACYDSWYDSTPYNGTITTASVTLSSSSISSLAVGGTTALTATVVPSSSSVTWTSTDASVATVSSGTVTGVAAGTCSIIASITYDGTTYSATCTVTVVSE